MSGFVNVRRVTGPAPLSITDTFDRADSATLGTTSDGKKVWTYNANSAYAIATNLAQVTTAGGIFGYAAPAVIDTGRSDGTVSIYRHQGGGGVVSRYVDDSNFWLVDSTAFGVVSAGAFDARLSLTGTNITYAVTWAGDTWTVKDGAGTVIGTGAAAIHNTATKWGFWGGATHLYNDFSYTG